MNRLLSGLKEPDLGLPSFALSVVRSSAIDWGGSQINDYFLHHARPAVSCGNDNKSQSDTKRWRKKGILGEIFPNFSIELYSEKWVWELGITPPTPPLRKKSCFLCGVPKS